MKSWRQVCPRLQSWHELYFYRKFRALRFSLVIRCFLCCSIFWGVCSLHAEKADRDKPVKIEADKLDYDDLQQVSIFVGKVSLIKGTIDMRGDRLEMRQDPDGYQFGILTPAAGARATYRQKRDIQNETVEGIAQRIEYDGKQDKIILLGNAELRRYKSAALSDEMSGQRIVYENLTDRFSIDDKNPSGLGANGASSGSSKSRVRAVLSPQKPLEQKP